MERIPKHNLAIQLIYSFYKLIAEWDICLGAGLWPAEGRELCCLTLLKQGCLPHVAWMLAGATYGHFLPMFWWGHCHQWPCALPTPFLFLIFHCLAPLSNCSGISISQWREGGNTTGEIKGRRLTLVSQITMWMKSSFTVSIWGASAVAGRSKLYIRHPRAPTGKAVMFAAGWVLDGLTLSRRIVLNLLVLLLVSALGAAVGWTAPDWCPPIKPHLPLGGSSRGTERSAMHLNWDVNTCFTVTGASSLHGRIWIVPGTFSAACQKPPCAGWFFGGSLCWTGGSLAPCDMPNCLLLWKLMLSHLAMVVLPGVCHKGRWELQEGWAWATPGSEGTDRAV